MIRRHRIVLIMAACVAIFVGCKPEITGEVRVTSPARSISTSDKTVVVSMDDPDLEEAPIHEPEPETPEWIDYEAALRESYNSQLGVREKTGKNDGKDVEKYLKSTGLGKGNPWCAAFVHWNLEQVGIPNEITAWSPTAYSKSRVTWKGGKWKKEFRPGQVFTLWYSNLGRIGHTGFVDDLDGSVAITVEGNTNSAGSREGDGVYKKRRPLNGLYAICDWYPKK